MSDSPTTEPHPTLVTLSHVTYGLHVLELGTGAFGAATVTALMRQSAPSSEMTAGFVLWGCAWVALGVWAIYRVVRGWRALSNRRAVP